VTTRQDIDHLQQPSDYIDEWVSRIRSQVTGFVAGAHLPDFAVLQRKKLGQCRVCHTNRDSNNAGNKPVPDSVHGLFFCGSIPVQEEEGTA